MRYWYTPVRLVAGQVLAWCKTGKLEQGLPVYALKKPTNKDKVLHFPMRGKARGCIQHMGNPK
jgi:hypothetical protein